MRLTVSWEIEVVVSVANLERRLDWVVVTERTERERVRMECRERWAGVAEVLRAGSWEGWVREVILAWGLADVDGLDLGFVSV